MEYLKGIIVICLLYLLKKGDMATQSDSKPRVCIIGAGYCGLATARHMKDYGFNFTVFEASRYIGGTWRYDPRIGTDENGIQLCTKVYKKLRINSVRESMEFPDHPFPKGSISHVSGNCIYKYLLGYTEKFDLAKHVQIESLVSSVERLGDKWNVTYMKTNTKENVSEECGFVVVANGEYIVPHVPHFAKQEEFQGKILHSQNFRDSEHYRGLRVAVVGAGPSAFDLASHLINVTAMFIHSHHYNGKLPKDIGNNYKTKPDIKYFTKTGAVFVDNSTEEFDVIILCTGYRYSFPFLKYESSGISWTKEFVMPLYNQLVNINYPTMTFVGTGKYSLGIIRDKQGHYSALLAAGLVKLPSKDDMFKQWFEHAKLQQPKYINHIGYDNTASYAEALLNGTQITRPPRVFSLLVENIIGYIFSDFLHFRDYEYTLRETDYDVVYKPAKQWCNL